MGSAWASVTAGAAVTPEGDVTVGTTVMAEEGVEAPVPAPRFGLTKRTTPATTAIRIITIAPMAIYFPFPRRRGFCGIDGSAEVGIEPGTSGDGCKSFGEKSRGMNLRADGFAGVRTEGDVSGRDCRVPSVGFACGNAGVSAGEDTGGSSVGGIAIGGVSGGTSRNGSRGTCLVSRSMSGSMDWIS